MNVAMRMCMQGGEWGWWVSGAFLAGLVVAVIIGRVIRSAARKL